MDRAFYQTRAVKRNIHIKQKREEGESAFDDTMEAGESRSLLEENDHSNKISGSNSESVSGVKGTNKDVTIGIKRKINCN